MEPSYYSGVDDGESWNEGSTTQSVTIGGLSPGNYVLRLQPVYEPTCALKPVAAGCPTAFSVRLKNDIPLYWPGILALLFILAVPIVSLMRIGAFESRRWAESNVRGSGTSSSSSSDDD